MASRLFHWLLWTISFSVKVSTEPKYITAEPGQNVTLTCRLSDQNQVLVLEWSRTDLQEDEYVFLYRDDKSDSDHQHQTFKNRVFLKDRRMEDGDLSVVLKNVTTHDNGTYESRVEGDGRTRRSVLDSPPICTINLLVIPPGNKDGGKKDGGDKDGGNKDGGHKNGGDKDGGGNGKQEVRQGPPLLVLLAVLIPVALLGLLLAVFLLLMISKRKSAPRPAGSGLQPDRELRPLSRDGGAVLDSSEAELLPRSQKSSMVCVSAVTLF